MPAILDSPEAPARVLLAANSAGGLAAILDLPEVRASVAALSVEAYESLAKIGVLGRHDELIRGLIVKQMPKSPLHCKLLRRIFLFLLAFQRGGIVVFSERPLRLRDSAPEPDVMIVQGGESDFDAGHPATAALVVEIAVSSAELDRAKALLYAEAGVPEYWIVLAEEHQMEVYRQPKQGVYQQKRLYTMDETLTCESVPGLQVKLADWFA